MLGAKRTHAEIAKQLGKHRSAVTREIRRNTNAGGIYFEVHADNMKKRRRVAAKSPARILYCLVELSLHIFKFAHDLPYRLFRSGA